MLKIFERWFVVLMLFYLSSGLLGFIWPDSETSLFRPESSSALLAIEVLFYSVTFLLIALRWQRFRGVLFGARWVLALSLLAICSAAWSEEPSLTFRRGMVLLGTTAFGMYLGSNFSLREQLRLITRTFGLIAGLSILFALLLPTYGIDHDIHGGSWQGVFAQKNLLGKAMVVSVIAFLSSEGLRRRTSRWLLIAASVLLAVLSNSLTSLVVIAALLLLIPAYRLLRAKLTVQVPSLIVLCAGIVVSVAVAVKYEDIVLGLLDRSISLTGRTGIWEWVWASISQRMILGYGFNGFWSGIGGASASVVLNIGFVAKHAHDGFLDLWLELGIIGLALFVIGYLSAVRSAFHLLKSDAGLEAAWPMQYLAFMLLYHIAEGPILRQNSLYWALYTATVVYVSSLRWVTQRSTAQIVAAPESAEATIAEGTTTVEPQLDYLPG